MSSLSSVIGASMFSFFSGLYLIFAPFILTYPLGSAEEANDILIGTLVAVLAFIRVTYANCAAWLGWAITACGIWLILSPVIFGYAANTTAVVNDVGMGAAIVILGLWSVVATPGEQIAGE